MELLIVVLFLGILAALAAPSRGGENPDLEQLIKDQGDQIRQMQPGPSISAITT